MDSPEPPAAVYRRLRQASDLSQACRQRGWLVMQSQPAAANGKLSQTVGRGVKAQLLQLPALVLGQTVVVVSPLIALMQDQVAQLADMGIPAALLNSTLPPAES